MLCKKKAGTSMQTEVERFYFAKIFILTIFARDNRHINSHGFKIYKKVLSFLFFWFALPPFSDNICHHMTLDIFFDSHTISFTNKLLLYFISLGTKIFQYSKCKQLLMASDIQKNLDIYLHTKYLTIFFLDLKKINLTLIFYFNTPSLVTIDFVRIVVG